ncbi:MAG: 1-deoxy-D-xylulose-5-phosphate synthase N-terminal domain-containing protein [bacterium]
MNYLLSERQKKVRKRIVEISHLRKFTHIGSCLCVVDIIDGIYDIKNKNEKFVLSNGHAAVALYSVLEMKKIITSQVAEGLNIHPDRNPKLGIDVSSGSLGQGLPIAVGFALANRKKHVYCVVSDGECMEGSVFEALRIARMSKLDNLTIVVGANGWGGYSSIVITDLIRMLDGLGYDTKVINGHDSSKIKQALRSRKKGKPNLILAETKSDQLPFLKDLDAHYYLMTDDDYKVAINILS